MVLLRKGCQRLRLRVATAIADVVARHRLDFLGVNYYTPRTRSRGPPAILSSEGGGLLPATLGAWGVPGPGCAPGHGHGMGHRALGPRTELLRRASMRTYPKVSRNPHHGERRRVRRLRGLRKGRSATTRADRLPPRGHLPAPCAGAIDRRCRGRAGTSPGPCWTTSSGPRGMPSGSAWCTWTTATECRNPEGQRGLVWARRPQERGGHRLMRPPGSTLRWSLRTVARKTTCSVRL